MKYLYILLLFAGSTGLSQETWNDFTGKEKAFLYHQTRRVELLKLELFHLFEFTDSIPYINDTLPDYNYVEKQIVQHPSLLKLHADQMMRKSDGLVSDLATRYAIWELSQILQYRNSTAEEDKPLLEKLKTFEKYVLEEVPQSAVRTLNNGDYVLAKTVQGYYAASLTVSDKMAAILNSGYAQLDQMLIINAIMSAEEKYVNARAKEIFKVLGGGNAGVNHLSAVGDGSNWADITGGFNTPYSIGLPDENGIFKFNIEQIFDKEKDVSNLEVKVVERKQFTTNSDSNTIVHVDVFGYHPERQTTIAIQKGGNSYVLYGKNDHRLVSPDSTYGEGTTYWRLMYNLEFYHIAGIKADLYGKRGYEYQIDLFEKKIETTKLQIKKTEYRLDKLRYTPEGKPKIKKKKRKKKNLGMSDQDGGGHPTSKLSKLDKRRNVEQNRLVQLNGLLNGQKSMLEQLKIDMEEAYIKLVLWETKLDGMRKNIGYIMMEYEVENNIYLFKDGAQFNYLTQDFTFPKDRSEEVFQIFHISFGKEVFDDKIDENFAHIHISKHAEHSKHKLKRIVLDEGRKALTVSDSIQIMELFTYLATKEGKASLEIIAGGVLGENNGHYFRDSTQQIKIYNKDAETNRGLVKYDGELTTRLNLSVTVFEDAMIPENFGAYQVAFEKLKTKNAGLNEIDFYSGIRAKNAAETWLELLRSLVPIWVDDSGDQNRILGKLKKLKPKKVQFLCGGVPNKVPNIGT
ncbi:MAG: hypothetical protein GQ574_24680 [Crocinitomix sp.]|nr:hypothetical protein [Crocinitomix sp.]